MPDIAPTTGMIPVFAVIAVVVILFLTEKVRQKSRPDRDRMQIARIS
jgi:hypothetical protein